MVRIRIVEKGDCLLLKIGFMKREWVTEHEREGEEVLIGLLRSLGPLGSWGRYSYLKRRLFGADQVLNMVRGNEKSKDKTRCFCSFL